MSIDPERVKSLFLAASNLLNTADRAPISIANAAMIRNSEPTLRHYSRRHDVSPPRSPEPFEATGEHLPDGGDESEQSTVITKQPMQSRENDTTFTSEDVGHSTPAGEYSALGLGTIIAGRYTLVEVIGEGGMGSVYLASQTEPVKRQVALKLIKSGMDSRSVLARFDAERQALALMDHPNIARIYDGGVTPAGQPFFVMELVKGVPLTEYLRSAAAVGAKPGWSCSCRSARRCSTPTRRGSSTATSSRAMCWSRKSTAGRRRR